MEYRNLTHIYLYTFIAHFFCLTPAHSHAQEAPPLDLNRCYELAIARSESLAISHEERKAAEAIYSQAIAAIMPQINFEAGPEWQKGGARSGSSNSSIGNGDQFRGRIEVSHTIFQGFREFHLASAAKSNAQAAALDTDRARQLLYRDVATLFFQILSLEADLIILSELEQALAERQTELQRRVSLGRSRDAELLAAQTELAAVAVTKEQTAGLARASRELMAFLTGLRSSQILLKDTFPFPQANDLRRYLDSSGARADIQASAERMNASKKSKDATEAEWWPSISVDAGFEMAKNLNNERVNEDWDVTLLVEMPLFDGGLRIAKNKEATARRKAAEYSFSRIRRLAEYEVRSTYTSFESTTAQWLALETVTESARDNLEQQRKDYDLGRSSNLDVLNALARLHELRRNQNTSYHEAKARMVELLTAAGQTPEPHTP